MRVALVGPFPPQQKGEAEYVQRSAEALTKFLPRDNIAIISQYDAVPSVERSNGFLVRRAIFDRSNRPSYAPQRELVEATIQSGAEIVHVHFGPNRDYGGRLGEPLAGALRTLRARGVRTVLTLHSQWMPSDVLSSAPAQRLPRILRPLVVRYFGRFMRRLRASCDAFLCVASARNSPLTDEFSRAYRLPNVGEELFSCVNEFSPPPQTSRPLIFSFGFLRPEKGFEVLIEAFLQYRKTGGAGRLVIAGVPLTDDDRRYARMLRALGDGHDSIEFVEAYLEKDDVDRYLRSCSVFVLPYLSAVGNSAPLHSALGFGRPVIATAIPRNLPLRNAVTLVPPASSNALANALGRLFNVPGALDESAARARSAAMERGADALASEQYDLYRHLLDKSADHRLKHRVE